VRAEIVVLNGLSSHADHGDLLRMLGRLERSTRIRLVHGEPDRAAKLQDGLKGIGFADVEIPDHGESAAV
jgi:metallo-beta-lactamase family protein